MTNLAKLKTLKDYELATVIGMINNYVEGKQIETGAAFNLDAIDSVEDYTDIVISWLHEEYDKEQGFDFSTEEGIEVYANDPVLQQFKYLGKKVKK